jgi:hypothetical protein
LAHNSTHNGLDLCRHGNINSLTAHANEELLIAHVHALKMPKYQELLDKLKERKRYSSSAPKIHQRADKTQLLFDPQCLGCYAHTAPDNKFAERFVEWWSVLDDTTLLQINQWFDQVFRCFDMNKTKFLLYEVSVQGSV